MGNLHSRVFKKKQRIPKSNGEWLLGYWIDVLLNEDFLYSHLLCDIFLTKSLSLVSRFVASKLKPHIEKAYFFNFSRRGIRSNRFIWYCPQKIKEVNTVESFPSNVQYISFSSSFNEPVDDILPNNITRIKFGWCFNQSVNCLPPQLTHLELGVDFKQPLDSLPSTLVHLTIMGFQFNERIDNLPASLTHLFFGEVCAFNHPIDRLPANLTHLALGCGFDQKINCLPKKLTYLLLCRLIEEDVYHFPASLKQLKILCLSHDIKELQTCYPNMHIESLESLPFNCWFREQKRIANF
eukprot:TRINITY_DN2068_c0_g1_i2.p1 TRINITY_DN2068_c0_g1~~TRINITY_DN2068_c0_g1_i2.p1  ORF type:complete len:295 (+),score=24.47 TRINITY_DN2068_c0_g1_i2:785-1669(+)